jgi:hypothetical protein
MFVMSAHVLDKQVDQMLREVCRNTNKLAI